MAANSLPFRVWAVDVSEYDAVSVKNVVEEFLPENEWQMVLRFLRPIDQIRALAGKLLTRLVLSKEHGCQWDDIRIATTPERRPFLAHPSPNFDFNLTHDGDWVAIAFTPATAASLPSSGQNAQLGIDVMEIALPHYEPSVLDFVKTMEMTMTNAETSWVRNVALSESSPSDTDRERLRRLFALWTHKEAYTKALGLGMGFDFRNVELRFWDVDRNLLHVNGQLKDDAYSFMSLDLPCGGRHNLGEDTSGPLKGAGTGQGSQLVVAYPTAQQRPVPMTYKEAKESSLLHIWNMHDLVEASKHAKSR